MRSSTPPSATFQLLALALALAMLPTVVASDPDGGAEGVANGALPAGDAAASEAPGPAPAAPDADETQEHAADEAVDRSREAQGAVATATALVLGQATTTKREAERADASPDAAVAAAGNLWARFLQVFRGLTDAVPTLDLFARGEPATASNTRTAFAPTEAQAAGLPLVGAAAAIGLLALVAFAARRLGFMAALPLFSRIEGSQLLKHPKRAEIVTYVRANPGANTSEVARASELAWGSAVHHLDKLVRDKILAVRQVNNQRCFFEMGAVDRREMDIRSALKRESPALIARFLARHPGACQKEIAHGLGLSRAVTSFHVRKMAELGVVERVRDGKEMHVTLTALAHDAMQDDPFLCRPSPASGVLGDGVAATA